MLKRRLSSALLATLFLLTWNVYAVAAHDRYSSAASGLSFEVPHGWHVVTHGAPEDDHGHDHDDDHDHDDGHSDSIPHHALGNYEGIKSGEMPASEDEAVMEVGALPNGFMCPDTLTTDTGPIRATVDYFAQQYGGLPEGSSPRLLTLANGIEVSAMDFTFGDLDSVWFAWPMGNDVTAWMFVGSPGSWQDFIDEAADIAASLELDVSAAELTTMFADFAPAERCPSGEMPDTSVAGATAEHSRQGDPFILLILAALGMATFVITYRQRPALR